MNNNYSNGLEQLLNSLYAMVQDAWAFPLSNDKCMIERDKALDILEEIRANLPNDLKTAQDIVERRNELLTSGKREAEAIKKQAEEYAHQLINENEIVMSARRRANELISLAETRSQELKKVANDYCDDILKKTEESISCSLDELRKSRQQLRTINTGKRASDDGQI